MIFLQTNRQNNNHYKPFSPNKTDMTNNFFAQFSDYEDTLIQDFNNHPFYNKFEEFTKEEFKHYVLQLGFLSMEFIKFIEKAKLPLKSEDGKEAVRMILRDEIAQSGPTHQDNRFIDLIKCNFSPKEILHTPMMPDSKTTINNYYKLIEFPQDNYDLRTLITLRVLGEVLVGETYKHVVQGLKKHFNLEPK